MAPLLEGVVEFVGVVCTGLGLLGCVWVGVTVIAARRYQRRLTAAGSRTTIPDVNSRLQ